MTDTSHEITGFDEFILDQLSEHPTDIIEWTAKYFSVSERSVKIRLSKLVKAGFAVKTGYADARPKEQQQ